MKLPSPPTTSDASSFPPVSEGQVPGEPETRLDSTVTELEARVQDRTAALRRANEKLQNEIANRRRLEAEILEISEREQQRIGRDLHDDLGQRLVGISYMSHLLANNLLASGSPEAGHAASISELLTKALALVRSLARGLHPVSSASGGLAAALGDLAGRTSEIFQIHCHFEGPIEPASLPDATSTHLYRIAQEAVTNSVNHGSASLITIQLENLPELIKLTITDNGSGMPKLNPKREGMGLRIMNYRADVIGGKLILSNKSSGGASVTCIIKAASEIQSSAQMDRP